MVSTLCMSRMDWVWMERVGVWCGKHIAHGQNGVCINGAGMVCGVVNTLRMGRMGCVLMGRVGYVVW